MRDMEFSVTADVDASDLFSDDASDPNHVNWRFCMERATFRHRDACEFILHIGGGLGSEDYADTTMAEMQRFGCTAAFINVYEQARRAGAMRVLLHAG